MIVFNHSGRLGNQIFQYAGLKTLAQTDEKLLLLGFEDLQSIFEGIDAIIINSNSSKLERAFCFRLYSYAQRLARRNLISSIKESDENPVLISDPGIFRGITFVGKSYFQSESFFAPEAIHSLTLKPELLISTQQLINNVAQDNTPIFIHIRRGDYLNWPTRVNPAVLPASYYQNCIEILRSKIQNPFFIFTSDDPFYVRDVFGSLENSYLSQGSNLEDFALMTQCRGGILSASSFSWWAAYFAYLSHTEGIFLAPKYWAGHSIDRWYPKFIKSSFLSYVSV